MDVPAGRKMKDSTVFIFTRENRSHHTYERLISHVNRHGDANSTQNVTRLHTQPERLGQKLQKTPSTAEGVNLNPHVLRAGDAM